MAKLTLKQIRAGFGGKRALAALRGRFRKKHSRKAPVRKTRRTNTVARRRRTSRRRGKAGLNIAKTLVSGNAIFQMVEPSVRAGLVQALQSGDVNAIMTAIKTGAKDAVTAKNLTEALLPVVGYGVVKKLLGGLGIRSPRVGKVAAF